MGFSFDLEPKNEQTATESTTPLEPFQVHEAFEPKIANKFTETCVNIGDLKIKHLTSTNLDGSDLIPKIYEGGEVVWECSIASKVSKRYKHITRYQII